MIDGLGIHVMGPMLVGCLESRSFFWVGEFYFFGPLFVVRLLCFDPRIGLASECFPGGWHWFLFRLCVEPSICNLVNLVFRSPNIPIATSYKRLK